MFYCGHTILLHAINYIYMSVLCYCITCFASHPPENIGCTLSLRHTQFFSLEPKGLYSTGVYSNVCQYHSKIKLTLFLDSLTYPQHLFEANLPAKSSSLWTSNLANQRSENRRIFIKSKLNNH